MQVLEQRYYWLSPCSMAQAVQRLASALHEDETINPRQVWELLWWCIRVEYCITVNTCQHIISISLCVSLHVCSHSSHLRWNQDMMQSRVFQANSTQVFHAKSGAFDLTWIGCVSQLACHALPVVTGHGSPEVVWKLGLCRHEALLTQRSLIFDKYPGTVTQRSLMLWLISMHYVSMHLSMDQIILIHINSLTNPAATHILLEHHEPDRQQMQDVLGSDGWPDPKFYHKDDPPSLRSWKLILVKIAWGSP